MRPSIPLLLAAAAALFASLPAAAQLGGQDSPIGWAADSVELVDAENLIRLAGRVNVRQGEARLAADRMNIFLSPVGEGEDRQVERIEADGAVVYVTPLEVARGDHGVYLAASERITLTGDVTLVRGDSTLTGQELVIEPRTGRSSLTRESPSEGERVRGVFSAHGAAEIGSEGE